MHKLLIIAIILAVLVQTALLAGIFFYLVSNKTRRKYSPGARPNLSKILPVVGSAMLLISICISIHTWHFTRVALRTDGIVTALRESRDKDGHGPTYAPSFQFQDNQGKQHDVDSSFYTSPPTFKVGDKVQILYRGDNPDDASINNFWQVWGLSTILATMGGGMIFIGAILLFWPMLSLWLRGRLAQVLPV